ncbi:kinase-like protein [Periconia macrospinosa]|uniref:non-specific serine/threonine protein kinase n=1 Tax=Periconia macrospinosa TaxID=97972 RepID=A0A2V1E7P9_9PLEO|nr:kinase-like protein [Periconia macrospinosa]
MVSPAAATIEPIAPLRPPTPPPSNPSRPLHTLPPPFTSSNLQLLAQGAEALVYKTTFLTPNTPCVVKYRPPKPYRHPTLDRRLTKARILAEARVLVRAGREGVSVPRVLGADWEAGWLVLGWVEGGSVRAVLDGWTERVKNRRKAYEASTGHAEEKEMLDLMSRIGSCIGHLHSIGIAHGDLTTSNIMLKSPSADLNSTTNGQAAVPSSTSSGSAIPSLAGQITLIDFGLASHMVPHSADEEGAVDLYVLERAFSATHPAAEPLFAEVLKAYGQSWKGAKGVLKRLEDVRLRGRKRSMLG